MSKRKKIKQKIAKILASTLVFATPLQTMQPILANIYPEEIESAEAGFEEVVEIVPAEDAVVGGEEAAGAPAEGAAGEMVRLSDIFADATLAEIVAQELGVGVNTEIDATDLLSITNLIVNASIAQNIHNLNGIENLTNLAHLWLENNKISNLSPLANLTNLTRLHLDQNQIDDISPLANLMNLEVLGLNFNQISDLRPLSAVYSSSIEIHARGQRIDLEDVPLGTATPFYLYTPAGGPPLTISHTNETVNSLVEDNLLIWPTEGSNWLEWEYEGRNNNAFISFTGEVHQEVIDDGIVVEHTVTFDLHGGIEDFPTQFVSAGERITRPTVIPTRSGYTFTGWFTAETGGEEFDFNTPITANITIHAQWESVGEAPGVLEPIEHSVTFDLHGGVGNFPVQRIEDGSFATRPAESPTRSGYTFTGWFTAETGGEEFDFNTPITGDTTVHAQWDREVDIHIVIFDLHGGIGDFPDQAIEDGEFAEVPTEIPTRPGYTFTGWFTTATGDVEFDFSIPITADTTVHAQWDREVDIHIVIFDLHGGIGDFPEQTIEDGEFAEEPSEIPTRPGYTFTGWFTAEIDGEEFDFSTPITGDATVHAQWDDVEDETPPAAIDPTSISAMSDFLNANTPDNRIVVPYNATTEPEIIAAITAVLNDVDGLAENVSVNLVSQDETLFVQDQIDNITVELSINPIYSFMDQTIYFQNDIIDDEEEIPDAEEAPDEEETPGAEEAPDEEETPDEEEAPDVEEIPDTEAPPAAPAAPDEEEVPVVEDDPQDVGDTDEEVGIYEPAPLEVDPESIEAMSEFLNANSPDFRIVIPATATTEEEIIAAIAYELSNIDGLAADVTVNLIRQANTVFLPGQINYITVELSVNPTHSFRDQVIFWRHASQVPTYADNISDTTINTNDNIDDNTFNRVIIDIPTIINTIIPGVLPQTGASIINTLLIGAFMLTIGAVGAFVRTKKKRLE